MKREAGSRGKCVGYSRPEMKRGVDSRGKYVECPDWEN